MSETSELETLADEWNKADSRTMEATVIAAICGVYAFIFVTVAYFTGTTVLIYIGGCFVTLAVAAVIFGAVKHFQARRYMSRYIKLTKPDPQ